MEKCNRCDELDGEPFFECMECGPIYLCYDCAEYHRNEMVHEN